MGLSGGRSGQFQVVGVPIFKRSSARFLQAWLNNLLPSYHWGVCIHLLPTVHSSWTWERPLPFTLKVSGLSSTLSQWTTSTSIQLSFILTMSLIHLILIMCLAADFEQLSSACCCLHPHRQTPRSDLGHFSSGWLPPLLFGPLFVKYP